MSDQKQPSHSLLQAPLKVVNVGLEGFAQDLQHHGAPVLHVDWAPLTYGFGHGLDKRSVPAFNTPASISNGWVDFTGISSMKRRPPIEHAPPSRDRSTVSPTCA